MKRHTVRRMIHIMAILAVVSAIPLADGRGQGIMDAVKARNSRPDEARPEDMRPSFEVPPDAILVFPGGRQFRSLQKALDSCDGGRGNVYLGAGTLTGNWILPSGVHVYGAWDGETILVGQMSVTQATITFAPSGPSSSNQSSLNNLTIIGREVAAVEYSGNNANAYFEIDECHLQTLTVNPIPAVKVMGAGYGAGQEMELYLDWVEIESEYGGGLDIDAGSYVKITVDLDESEVATTLVDADFSDRTGTSLFMEGDSPAKCQTGIKTNNLEMLEVWVVNFDATGDAMEIKGTYAEVRISFFKTPATGIKVLNGSNLKISYSEFIDCSQPIYTDAGSTTTMAFCHQDFVEL